MWQQICVEHSGNFDSWEGTKGVTWFLGGGGEGKGRCGVTGDTKIIQYSTVQ